MAAHAQSGFVKSGNKPIPGAAVTAAHGDQKVVAITDQSGHYSLPPLADGDWTVEVAMFGFTPARGQFKQPGAPRELDFNLTLKPSPYAANLNRLAGRAQNGAALE